MSLLKCPECGEEVSEYADKCQKCGCPIGIIKQKQPKIEGHIYAKINGIEYDVTEAAELLRIYYEKDDFKCPERIKAYNIIRKQFHIPAGQFERAFDENTMIVAEINCDPIRQSTQSTQQSSNVPHCPVCNSTNIEKISFGKKAKGSFLFGFFSSDVRNQMHCKDCGYKF